MVAKQYESITLLFEDDNIKWAWKDSELDRFRELWDEGLNVQELAHEFGATKRSILLLVMDQDYKGEIKPRKFGLYGH